MSHLDQAAALATVDKTPEQLEAELWMQKRRSLRATTKRLLLLSKLADGLSTESIERIATAMQRTQTIDFTLYPLRVPCCAAQ